MTKRRAVLWYIVFIKGEKKWQSVSEGGIGFKKYLGGLDGEDGCAHVQQ